MNMMVESNKRSKRQTWKKLGWALKYKFF